LSGAPETGASPAGEQHGRHDDEPAVDPDSTVGTGSVFAIGCTLLMVIILFIGIALFIWRQTS